MGAVYEATHTLIGKRVAVKVLLEKYAQREAIVDAPRAGGAARVVDRQRAHHRHHRLRHHRGRPHVRRDGVPRGRIARRVPRARDHAARAAHPRASSRRSASALARRARQGHRPPRHQAGEPVPAAAQGARTSSRSWTSASRSRCARRGEEERLAAADPDRHGARHAAVHVARAGARRRRARSPRRHLRARRDHVRGRRRAACRSSATTTSASSRRCSTRSPSRSRELRPDLSEEFEAVVMKAMTKDREDRYANATEHARRSHGAARRSDALDRARADHRAAPPARRRAQRPSRALAWIAGIAVVVAAVAVTRDRAPGSTQPSQQAAVPASSRSTPAPRRSTRASPSTPRVAAPQVRGRQGLDRDRARRARRSSRARARSAPTPYEAMAARQRDGRSWSRRSTATTRPSATSGRRPSRARPSSARSRRSKKGQARKIIKRPPTRAATRARRRPRRAPTRRSGGARAAARPAVTGRQSVQAARRDAVSDRARECSGTVPRSSTWGRARDQPVTDPRREPARAATTRDTGFIGGHARALEIDDCPARSDAAADAAAARGSRALQARRHALHPGRLPGRGRRARRRRTACPALYPILKDIGQAYERRLEYEQAIGYLARYVSLPRSQGATQCTADRSRTRRTCAPDLGALEPARDGLRRDQAAGAQITIANDGRTKASGTRAASQIDVLGGTLHDDRRARRATSPIRQPIEVGIGKPYTTTFRLEPLKGTLRSRRCPATRASSSASVSSASAATPASCRAGSTGSRRGARARRAR